MLNMLIASMTDTFANVQTDAQRDLALARAWIVARVEHNSMLTLVSITETIYLYSNSVKFNDISFFLNCFPYITMIVRVL